MYIPAHFEMAPERAAEMLRAVRAADLITNTPEGMIGTFLPLLYEPEAHRLVGHVSRANGHWRAAGSAQESLVIVRGADAYVSPSFYPSKREDGSVAPTWNYEALHVYGCLVAHDDTAWVRALVTRLTEHHEHARLHPWSIDDAPPAYVNGLLRGIVGVSIEIARVEAKAKLSQNRSAEDRDGVIEGLGDDPVADAMRR